MQVESLDAVPCVKTAETRNARAAEAARTVVENSEIVHVRSPLYLILRLVCASQRVEDFRRYQRYLSLAPAASIMIAKACASVDVPCRSKLGAPQTLCT